MDKIGFHHFFIGLVLILIGFINLLDARLPWFWALTISGIYICLDDGYQHFRQIKHPEYRSPLHKLYGSTLYKLKFIRWLNNFTDKMFGRK